MAIKGIPCLCGNLKTRQAKVCLDCRNNEKENKAGVTDSGRVCARCNRFKAWTDFTTKRRGYNGRDSRCKDCCAEIAKIKMFHLKKIGWDIFLWEACYFIQEGICAIGGCNNLIEVADHDADTEEPRALLCHSCNLVLGKVKENPAVLRGLAEYATKCNNLKL